ncbi:MAG: haloacid dehalogenase [Bacteroidetes bacterium HGW-Bacteroidetes-7]|jgi:Ca2+-transporting ATPase|nr:MAG: haloacid dehalogenase [Bacteroidetes bacterium HGW-Bacteroidetes-7]
MAVKSEKKYTGLTSDEVEKSRKLYGRNVLTPPERTPLWRLFLQKFSDPIIRILLIAALLSFLMSIKTGETLETVGIIFAIALATGIAFWFEADAGKKFEILNKVNDETPVKVIRDGLVTEIPKMDVVKGDIVILETGDEIPADGYLKEALSISVNESALTGEPMTRKGIPDTFTGRESTYPVNMLLKGTTVLEGYCVFEVTNIGDSTEYGKVARKSAEVTNEPTPLNSQLEQLAKFIGFAGFTISVLTFAILFTKDVILGHIQFSSANIYTISAIMAGGFVAMSKVWMPILEDGFDLLKIKIKIPESIMVKGWLFWLITGIAASVLIFAISYIAGFNPFLEESWIESEVAVRLLRYFMVSVTLIVVAVPEGLPMAVTLALAMSMRKMLASNNLVRKMHATETVGAATVICTDKTGTLTMNQMRVAEEYFEGERALVYESIALNSTAHLDLTDIKSIKSLGNPTEAALLIWMHEKASDYLQLREESDVFSQLTFSTERKYMATVAFSKALDSNVLYVKGAPEIIAGFTDNYPVSAIERLAGFQSKAMRTLGFSYRLVESGENLSDVEALVTKKGLKYLGIVAISDPLRVDASDAVASCIAAGIKVKMVTGDTMGTAREISRRIGIVSLDEKEYEIITGDTFSQMNDSQVLELKDIIKVMCRAKPSDKERFVRLLQRAGEVVAVTGDGTNDAPALNYAHVGLSMGSGTSVAKEASDITLIDDSFASIVSAVLWGRSLYKNIQRFIIFQLTINLTALIIVLIGSIFGHELPLTVTQMLWVNLIMDTFAAGALASLPPEQSVMRSKPRAPGSFIVTPSMRANILLTGAFFTGAMLTLLYLFTSENGQISEYNLSLYFTIFVMLQFWNLFNAKAYGSNKSAFINFKSSKGFLIVAFLILAGQFLIVQFAGEIFRAVPLSFADWIKVFVGTSVVLWIGEFIRMILRISEKTNR